MCTQIARLDSDFFICALGSATFFVFSFPVEWRAETTASLRDQVCQHEDRSCLEPSLPHSANVCLKHLSVCCPQSFEWCSPDPRVPSGAPHVSPTPASGCFHTSLPKVTCLHLRNDNLFCQVQYAALTSVVYIGDVCY